MLVPASAIGALSILLVVGLSALGILAQVNWVIANIFSNGKFSSYPKTLAEWVVWLAAFTFAFWLSFTLLSVTGTWRRVVLWVTAVTLVAAWAPVDRYFLGWDLRFDLRKQTSNGMRSLPIIK